MVGSVDLSPPWRGQGDTIPRVGVVAAVGHTSGMSLTPLAASDRDRLSSLALSYAEVGHTALALPDGYRHVRRVAVLGHGRPTFERAAAQVLGWQVQSRAGLEVRASSATAEVGSVVELRLGVAALVLKIPCRVVYVVDEPLRRGFAYGTLPGHPESGEEAFVVSYDPGSDEVTLQITAFSKPATLLTRLGGPVASIGQDLMTRRYLSALRP